MWHPTATITVVIILKLFLLLCVALPWVKFYSCVEWRRLFFQWKKEHKTQNKLFITNSYILLILMLRQIVQKTISKQNLSTKQFLINWKINIPYNRTSNKHLKMLKPFIYFILYCTTNHEYIITRVSFMHPIPLKIKSVVKKVKWDHSLESLNS